MNALRILYMGTPDFAVEGLQKLLKSHHKIVGVTTAPDRSSGRGQKICISPVKKIALKHNILILQPSNLKSKNFINSVKELDLDLIVVVAFRMLPQVLWQTPKYGAFNLHASLLPDYRGAAPINWAIINGETQTGVTTFFIDRHIDTGAIILQKAVNIHPNDTARPLHDRLMVEGGKLILETTNIIADRKAYPKAQSQQSKKFAPKIFQETRQICWKSTPKEIYNFVRGLAPYLTAWSNLQNDKQLYMIKIYEVRPVYESHSLEFGCCVVDKKSIKVAVQEGFVFLKVIQLPNKKPMPVENLLNGFLIDKNAKFINKK